MLILLLLEGTLTQGLALAPKTWKARKDQLRAEMMTVMRWREIPWSMKTWSDGAQKCSLIRRS